MWMKEGKTSGEMVCPTTVNHYDSPTDTEDTLRLTDREKGAMTEE